MYAARRGEVSVGSGRFASIEMPGGLFFKRTVMPSAAATSHSKERFPFASGGRELGNLSSFCQMTAAIVGQLGGSLHLAMCLLDSSVPGNRPTRGGTETGSSAAFPQRSEVGQSRKSGAV